MHCAALRLVEKSPSTLECIALIYAQLHRFGDAIRTLHTALPLHTCLNNSSTASDLLNICVRRYAQQLQTPLLFTTNTPEVIKATGGSSDEFEVGRGKLLATYTLYPFVYFSLQRDFLLYLAPDITEDPPKERFQLLDNSLSTAPPSGIPSIRNDLDIFQTPERPDVPDPTEDVSMELD